MCHSSYWATEQSRREQERREREAERKRAETIDSLLAGAGKQAEQPAAAPVKESAPAK